LLTLAIRKKFVPFYSVNINNDIIKIFVKLLFVMFLEIYGNNIMGEMVIIFLLVIVTVKKYVLLCEC